MDAETRWYANADEIVQFMNGINPYWTIWHMRQMWYEHLRLTKEMAVTELTKDYAKSAATLNEFEKEGLMMADDFLRGITCQFDL